MVVLDQARASASDDPRLTSHQLNDNVGLAIVKVQSLRHIVVKLFII